MPELQTEQADSQKPLVDFDTWSELAQSDPEAFEVRRTQLIEQLIRRVPAHKQRRMHCLQWKIDQVRARASNPMAACIKLSEMMWVSLAGPGGLQEVLERVRKGNFERAPRAIVLDFPPRPDSA